MLQSLCLKISISRGMIFSQLLNSDLYLACGSDLNICTVHAIWWEGSRSALSDECALRCSFSFIKLQELGRWRLFSLYSVLTGRKTVTVTGERKGIPPINFTHNFIVPIYSNTMWIKSTRGKQPKGGRTTQSTVKFTKDSVSFANKVGNIISCGVKSIDSINNDRTQIVQLYLYL